MTRRNQRFYTLQFDGASCGNPGPAGAGAVLFDENGNVLYHFRKGLGYQTNNVAEYHGLILGLEQAIMKGCKNINVQGDSQLVINQFQGSWRANNPHLRSLCEEALELRDDFWHLASNIFLGNLTLVLMLKQTGLFISKRVKLKKIVSINDLS